MAANLTDDPNDPRFKTPPPKTGMQDVYLVLSEEERAKGFVRPVYREYRHVGRKPYCGKPADHYPDGVDPQGERWLCCMHDDTTDTCKGWMMEKNTWGCGAITKMGLALCETYAAQPGFYSHTFCASCNKHLPVSEFCWVLPDGTDGPTVGT